MHIVEHIARNLCDQSQHATFFWERPPRRDPVSQKIIPGKKGFDWRKGHPLPDEYLRRHIARERDVQAAVLLEHDGKVSAIVFDLDDHDGYGGSEVWEATRRLADAIIARGWIPSVFTSGGGVGTHTWVRFSDWKRKDTARREATEILASIGLKEGRGGGVRQGVAEIFPCGRLIGLPGARESRYCRYEDGVLYPPGEYPQPSELPISYPAKPGPKGRARAPIDAEGAVAAFVCGIDGGDYDAWLKALAGIKAGLKEQGFDHALAWSKGQLGFVSDADCRAKWESIEPVRLPPEAFWLTAVRNGYRGGVPANIKADKKETEKQALIEVVKRLPIARSKEGGAFAEVSPRRWAEVGSTAVREKLARAAYDEERILLTSETAKAALLLAQSYATDSVDFHVRCARSEGRVFYAVDDEAATILELTPTGVVPVEDPPVRFKMTDGLPALVADQGSIDDLDALLAIDPLQLDFLLAVLVKLLIQPDTPHPILLLAGPQGATKSSTLETLVMAVDPRPALRAGLTSKEDDLVVAAANSFVVSFDNVSELTRISDALCRLSTGGGIKKRALYTNGELYKLDVCRPVFLNGIDPAMSRQDLVSRALRIELQVPSRRISETALKALRQERLPYVRRYLLDLACHVLASGPLPEISEPIIRMTDFAEVGEAVWRLRGRAPGDFEAHYAAMLRDLADEEADGDPLVIALEWLLSCEDEGRVIEGDCTLILKRLREAARSGDLPFSERDLPNGPRGLSAGLRRALPALAERGIKVEQGSRRAYSISRNLPEIDLDDLPAVIQDSRSGVLVETRVAGGERLVSISDRRGEVRAPF